MVVKQMVSVVYTCLNNEVISSVWKHYFALGLGLGLVIFGQTYFQASVVDLQMATSE